jgi:hypothetical protein
LIVICTSFKRRRGTVHARQLRLDVGVVEARRALKTKVKKSSPAVIAGDHVVEPPHGLEVPRLGFARAASGARRGLSGGAAGAAVGRGCRSRRSRSRRRGCRAAATRTAAAAEAGGGTDGGHRVLQLDRAPGARAKQAILRRGQRGGPAAPDVDRDLAVDVLPLEVVDVHVRQAQAIADELGVGGDRLLAAGVGRKRDAFAVLEGLRLAVDGDRHGRVARDVHAEQLDHLEVRPVVAARLHAPLSQVIGDVGPGDAESFGKDLTSLQLVRRDVGEPFLHVGLRNGRHAGRLAHLGQAGGLERQHGRKERPAQGRNRASFHQSNPP